MSEYPTRKEVSDALRTVAEQLNAVSESLAQLGAGLSAVKAALAREMNSADPALALKQIQTLEENFLQLDPNAAARKKFAEAIELLKVIEKHGGPKQA